MLGRVVESVEVSERFLWDLRRTAQELVVENHALRLGGIGAPARPDVVGRALRPEPGRRPCLGAPPTCPCASSGPRASIPISAPWRPSRLRIRIGRPVVGAESFTSDRRCLAVLSRGLEAQGDWAPCAGVNRFVFHRYAAQPCLDRYPGMTFGPYGVHWDRTETWWDMAWGYHSYLVRCQTMLRRGLPVADILYLDAEGAPTCFGLPRPRRWRAFPTGAVTTSTVVPRPR